MQAKHHWMALCVVGCWIKKNSDQDKREFWMGNPKTSTKCEHNILWCIFKSFICAFIKFDLHKNHIEVYWRNLHRNAWFYVHSNRILPFFFIPTQTASTIMHETLQCESKRAKRNVFILIFTCANACNTDIGFYWNFILYFCSVAMATATATQWRDIKFEILKPCVDRC